MDDGGSPPGAIRRTTSGGNCVKQARRSQQRIDSGMSDLSQNGNSLCSKFLYQDAHVRIAQKSASQEALLELFLCLFDCESRDFDCPNERRCDLAAFADSQRIVQVWRSID